MHQSPHDSSAASNALNSATALHKAGRISEALELYLEAASIIKKDSELFFTIANIQKQMLNCKDALSNINKAIKLNDSVKKYYYERASIRSELKQYENALDDLRFILKYDPSDYHVISAMSAVHYKKNDFEKALHYIESALKFQDKNTIFLFNKAKICEALNKHHEAIQCYEKCLDTEPNNPECLNNIGFVYLQMQNDELAVQYFDKAIDADPNYVAAWYNRANNLLRSKKFSEAVKEFNHIIQIDQKFLPAYNNKGFALLMLQRYDEAIQTFEAAILLDLFYTDCYINLGKTLKEKQDYQKAIACFDRAIEIDAKSIEAYKSRGALFTFINRYDEALRDLNKAIKLNPDDADAHCTLADVLLSINSIDLAFKEYSRAIEIDSNYAEAYWNRSGIKLLQGNYEEGLKEYEWRKKTAEFASNALKPGYELTQGVNLQSKSLFIYPELYLGDLIQFSRFGLLAHSMGAHVTMAAPAHMHALLKTVSEEITYIPKNEVPEKYDYHCALMSLPYAFSMREDTIPYATGYMKAAPQLVKKWRDKIDPQNFNIGICWQGSSLPYSIPLRRSVHLSNFYKISKIAGVNLINLQKYDGLEQLNEIPADMKIETLRDEIDAGPDAFLDTAAILTSLDLVITVDTATAHLAGALGRPTWLILKDVPDWRWMLGRSDTPWYRSMRLFRNNNPLDWTELFTEIELELKKLVSELN